MERSLIAWYRVPMVWLLIAVPLSSVVAGFFLLGAAIQSDDGLVVDDYYRRGREINLDLARDRAAAAHDVKAAVRLDAARGEVRVDLRMTSPPPIQLELQFLHATRQGGDRRLLVPRMADGSYRIPLPVLARGRYYVQLAADDWRLLGSFNRPQETRLDIAAARP